MSEFGAETLRQSDADPIANTESGDEEYFSLRNSRWHWRWLAVGFLGLIALRVVPPLLDGSWLGSWLALLPTSVILIIFMVLPQLTLLVFPLLTRQATPAANLPRPHFWRCVLEALVAFQVVVAVLLLLWLIEILLQRFWPNVTFTPRMFEEMAYSPDISTVLGLLVFSFTVVPIAEEVFFRGFLHNALRSRMPWLAAVALQSFLFGAVHSYSLAHSLAAVGMGVVLTLVYDWRKSLLTPILIHMGINFIAAAGIVALMIEFAGMPALGVIGDPADARCTVRQVLPGSAAEEAGVEEGDVILTFNGAPIAGYRELRSEVRRYRPGDQIPITLERDGVTVKVIATLQQLKNLQPQSPP